MNTKQQFRKEMKKSLLLLETTDQLHELSLLVSKNLIQFFKDQNIDPLKLFVGAYAPYQQEPLWSLAWSKELKARTAFPTMVNDQMAYRLATLDELKVRTDFGHSILGPDESRPIVDPKVVLVPALAFDHKGTRLGRGKGYFDRALEKQTTTIKVGVCFEMQLLKELPHEAHDVKMDFIVTEKRIIKCSDVKTS